MYRELADTDHIKNQTRFDQDTHMISNNVSEILRYHEFLIITFTMKVNFNRCVILKNPEFSNKTSHGTTKELGLHTKIR
jgi:hypothetical protein